MTEKTDANSLGAALHDRDDGLQADRRVSRPIRAAFYVPHIQHGRGRQTSGVRWQVRQGEVRPQERAPDYAVVAGWSGFLLSIGAGAFALGMVIHNDTLPAQQHAPRAERIYYCAAGVEMPAFEPCKEMKGQRDI